MTYYKIKYTQKQLLHDTSIGSMPDQETGIVQLKPTTQVQVTDQDVILRESYRQLIKKVILAAERLADMTEGEEQLGWVTTVEQLRRLA